jgi:hypothetical protein
MNKGKSKTKERSNFIRQGFKVKNKFKIKFKKAEKIWLLLS